MGRQSYGSPIARVWDLYRPSPPPGPGSPPPEGRLGGVAHRRGASLVALGAEEPRGAAVL